MASVFSQLFRSKSPTRRALPFYFLMCALLGSPIVAQVVPATVNTETSPNAVEETPIPDDPQSAIRPRHWRLVWTRDPATSAMVAWNTNAAGTTHLLRWRKKGAANVRESVAVSGLFSYGDMPKEEMELHFHGVELEGLEPDTDYDVQFVSDGVESQVFYFHTASAGDTPFSLLFGADSRSDHEKRREMNQFVAGLVEQSESAEQPAQRVIGVLHAGDYAARGTSLIQWSEWMSDHEKMVTSKGRLIPIIPARGNHDRGRLFNECFGFASADEQTWYAISFGSLLRLITLNTEASIAGDQVIWLRKELAQSSATHRWVVPQYHRPGYAAVKIPSGALAHWVPIFEEFNVKLVCEGDGHVIKRTVPIRRGKLDETGVVYIGEGGLGVGPRTPKEKRWFLRSPGMSASGYHVQQLTFTPDKMSYACILAGSRKGDVIDRWAFPPDNESP